MSKNLRGNSSAPPLFPLLDKPSINIAAAGAGAPVVIWKKNPLTGNFNSGKVAVPLSSQGRSSVLLPSPS